MDIFTSDYHHTDGEYLFVIRISGHISKSDASHAGHGEVQSRNVHGPSGRSQRQFRRRSFIVPNVRVRCLSNIR